jgi:hypothetical protein
MKRIVVIVGWLMVVCPMPTLAGDNPLLGTWKLKSFVREVFATGERYHQMGEHPNGYLSYSPHCRMYAILVWDNRIEPSDVAPNPEERVKLHQTIDFLRRDLHSRQREGDPSRRYFVE